MRDQQCWKRNLRRTMQASQMLRALSQRTSKRQQSQLMILRILKKPQQGGKALWAFTFLNVYQKSHLWTVNLMLGWLQRGMALSFYQESQLLLLRNFADIALESVNGTAAMEACIPCRNFLGPFTPRILYLKSFATSGIWIVNSNAIVAFFQAFDNLQGDWQTKTWSSIMLSS